MTTFYNPRFRDTIRLSDGTILDVHVRGFAGGGQQATVVRTHPKTGKRGLPELSRGAEKVRIVDCSDGETYIAELTTTDMFGDDIRTWALTSNTHDHVHPDEPEFPALQRVLDEPIGESIRASTSKKV